MSLTNFHNEFEKLLDRKYFSSEMHPLRRDAFSKLEATGFPTQKWEDWRFTNLSVLMDNHFLISEVDDAPQNTLDISQFEIEGIQTIVVYNGHLQEDISSVPDGVELLSGQDYMESKNGEINQSEKSPFDLLNCPISLVIITILPSL